MRLLDRVEVRALDVLDEGQLELIAIGELADDRRDPLEAGQLGGPDATFAGDELIAVEDLGHEDRLEHAVVRMLSASASRLACSTSRRGWYGLTRIVAQGISWAPVGVSSRVGISAERPRPRAGPAARALTGRLPAAPRDRRGHHRHAVLGPCASSTPAAGSPAAGSPARSRARNSRAKALYARRPSIPPRTARSAARGSGPRRGGRCAGSPCRRPPVPGGDEPRSRTSAERFVRASNIVSSTPLIARRGFRWSRTRWIGADQLAPDPRARSTRTGSE